MAHAYFVAGNIEEGIEAARDFSITQQGLGVEGAVDVTLHRYTLFPVEEARRIGEFASYVALKRSGKVMIIAAERLFHEAQNALLKVFEEPPPDTTLILVLPSEGMLLPTLRSRLMQLPGTGNTALSAHAQEFLGKPGKRADVVAAILKRAASDKTEEKQGARRDARELIEGVMLIAYDANRKAPRPELNALLYDLDRFMPIMFERAAPLKPVLEHLLIAAPNSLKA